MIPTEFHFIVSLYNHYSRMVYTRAPESQYIYTSLAQRKSQSYEMGNRDAFKFNTDGKCK